MEVLPAMRREVGVMTTRERIAEIMAELRELRVRAMEGQQRTEELGNELAQLMMREELEQRTRGRVN